MNRRSHRGGHPGYDHEDSSGSSDSSDSSSSDSDYEEDMPVNGGSDIEDVDPHQMVFEDDDHLFDEEEDQLTLDDESGYMYSAKMIYPPMEIDLDSDDYDDDEDVDFVYCKLISC